ncbi:MAG TPA: extracellular solute-binding protein [Acidimicrobiia bacterium]|nr:extracellular solute-binding protein [Acidimicrobiia bacterium]
MIFKPRRQRTLALLLVLGLVLAACASEGGDTTTTAAGGTDTTAAGGTDTTAAGGEEPSGDGDLLVWASRDYYIPPDQFASFTEETGVNVTFDIQANDDMLQQMLRMRDAGQPLPDILGAEDAFLIETFYDAGLIESHDEIAAQWEEEEPDTYGLLTPLVWEETALEDGTKTGMSVTANFDILYYNSEWFEEAGVTVPFDSLDAVLDGMRAMKEVRPDGIPLTVQARAGDGVTTLKTVLAASGAPFEGPIPDLTSEGGIYTINWFLQAAAEELLPPEAIAWGEDEARGAFISGDAGLILDGFTTAGDFNDVGDFTYPDVWNLTPVPVSEGGVALNAARTWAVLAGSENPDAAALILRYIAETENLVAAAGNGSVPMRQTEAIDDPRLQEIWPFFTEEVKEAYLNSTPTPVGENAGEVEAILEQMFGEIVVGTEKTAEELAAEYQPQLDETAP